MTDETVTTRCEIALPFNRRVIVRDVAFESGLNMIRLVFFEGKRVTQIDLDQASGEQLAMALLPATPH